MSSAWDGLQNNERITQLPHYAVNARAPDDGFFTRAEVAQYCYAVFCRVCAEAGIELDARVLVEPAAGGGAFFELLPPGSIGLDVNPRAAGVERADFLTWYPWAARGRKFAVVGNPPFGVRGAMALAFLNRALLFADAVGFVLPMSFYSNGKGSNMKRVRGAGLLHSEKLRGDAFFVPETGEAMAVNTVFQVWGKGRRAQVFVDYDVSDYVGIYTCCTSPIRFCGLGRGRVYDCFIASTFYKEVGIVRTFDEVAYGSGYGLVIKQKKREIMALLQGADWLRYCSDATNHCRHLRMYHIRKILGENGFGVAI